MFRKSSVIEVHNYDNKYLYYEDYVLWVSMLKDNKKFYNIQEYLYKVRAPKEFYGRKRGFSYLTTELSVNIYIHKIGYISFYELLGNIVPRVVIRLLPKRIVQKIYFKFLREKY